MARKRTIDPDLWTDDKVQNLADVRAIALYVGTISLADDYGRLEWSARQLWGRLFPSREDVKMRDVESWMSMLIESGLVIEYSVGGRTYVQHPSWLKHQYVSRPSGSKIPLAPEDVMLRCFKPDQKKPTPPDGGGQAPHKLRNARGQSPDNIRADSVQTPDFARTLSEHSSDNVRKVFKLCTEPARALGNGYGNGYGNGVGDGGGNEEFLGAAAAAGAREEAEEPEDPPLAGIHKPTDSWLEALDFCKWFVKTGLAADAIPEHNALDFRLRVARESRERADALLKTYGRDLCEKRARRFFALRQSGVIRKSASIETLADMWDFRELQDSYVPQQAGSNQRPAPPRIGTIREADRDGAFLLRDRKSG